VLKNCNYYSLSEEMATTTVTTRTASKRSQKRFIRDKGETSKFVVTLKRLKNYLLKQINVLVSFCVCKACVVFLTLHFLGHL
jgi:hypothetical protein